MTNGKTKVLLTMEVEVQGDQTNKFDIRKYVSLKRLTINSAIINNLSVVKTQAKPRSDEVLQNIWTANLLRKLIKSALGDKPIVKICLTGGYPAIRIYVESIAVFHYEYENGTLFGYYDAETVKQHTLQLADPNIVNLLYEDFQRLVKSMLESFGLSLHLLPKSSRKIIPTGLIDALSWKGPGVTL